MLKKMFFALALLTSPISLAHAQELTCSDVIKKMETAVGGMTSVNFQFVETCEDKVKCERIYKSSRPDWLNGAPIDYFYHDPTLAMAHAYVPTDDGGNTYKLSALTLILNRSYGITKNFDGQEIIKIDRGDGDCDIDTSSYSGADTQSSAEKVIGQFANEKYPDVRTYELSSFPDWPTLKGLLTLIKDRISQNASCKVQETNKNSTTVYNLNILQPNQKEGLRIEVDPSNWLPNKLLGHEHDKVFLTSEWKNVQTNEKSVEHSGDIKSLTITHAGLIRPAANKENCFYALPTRDINIFDTTKKSEEQTCYQIEDRTTIPAAYGLEMGITFKVEADSKSNHPIPILISRAYPELVYKELNLLKKLPPSWRDAFETTFLKIWDYEIRYDEFSDPILVEPGKEYLFKLGPTDGTLYPFLHFGKKYPSFKEAAWVELFYYDKKLGEQKFAFEDPKDPYAFLGTYGRSIPEFEKRVKKNPKDFNAHYLLAKGYSEKYDNRATTEFNKAIELNPKFIPAYLDRAKYIQSQLEYIHTDPFDHKLVLNDYYKVIDLDPSYSPELYPKIVDLTHKSLKELYSRTRNYFAEAIKKDPQNPKLFYNRGLFYKDAGKVQKALADFQKVLELDHNFKDAQEQIRILQEKPVEKN